MSNLLIQNSQDANAGATTDATVRSVTSSDSPEIALLTSIASGSGSVTVTYDDPVAISQGSSPGTATIRAASGTKVIRLHALVGTLHAAGTLKVSSTGGGAADLTGVMTIAKNSGIPIHFINNASGCLKTDDTGQGLSLTTVTGAFNGYAITSTADS